MADRCEVAAFLEKVRQAAKQQFRFENRSKNLAMLAQLGITKQGAKTRVLQLTPDHYYRGPTLREGRPGQEAWEFGLQIEGSEVYVKLEVRQEPSVCVCVSFHQPERPITYPFRRS